MTLLCLLFAVSCEATVPPGQILCLTEHAYHEQQAATASGRLVVVPGCGVAGPAMHVKVLNYSFPGPSLVRVVNTDLNMWVSTADLMP